MALSKRDIGLEILRGLQELKRGEHGRKTAASSVSIRDCTGLRQLNVPIVRTR
jgi:hypothetical protein